MSKRYTISRNQNGGYSIKDRNNQKASLNDIKSIFQNGGTASLTENNNLILRNSPNGLSRGIKKNVQIHPGSSLQDLKNSLMGGGLKLSESTKTAIKNQKDKVKARQDARQITYEQWLKGKKEKAKKEEEKRQQKDITQKHMQFASEDLKKQAKELINTLNENYMKEYKKYMETKSKGKGKKGEELTIAQFDNNFKKQNKANLKQLREDKFKIVYTQELQNELYLYNKPKLNTEYTKSIGLNLDDDDDPFTGNAQPVKKQTGFIGKVKTTLGFGKKQNKPEPQDSSSKKKVVKKKQKGK